MVIVDVTVLVMINDFTYYQSKELKDLLILRKFKMSKPKRRGIKVTNPDGSDGSNYGDGPNYPKIIGKAISDLIDAFFRSKR